MKQIPKVRKTIAEDQIRARAFAISRARGGTPGRELEDWLQAERELMALAATPAAPAEPREPQNLRRSSALVSLVRVAVMMAGGL